MSKNDSADVKLIDLIQNQNYDKAVETIINYILTGKIKPVEELILYLKSSGESDRDNFIKTFLSKIEKQSDKDISIVLSEMIKIMSQKEMFNLSERFIVEVTNKSLQAKLYIILAKTLEEKRFHKISVNMLKKSLEIAKKINIRTERSEILAGISVILAQQTNFDTVLKILDAIQVDSDKAYVIKTLLREVVKVKNREKKAELIHQTAIKASKIKNDNVRSDSFIKITRSMLNENMIYDALQLARQISDEKTKISTLGVIIELLAKSGQTWEAKSIADEAEEAASHIKETDKDRSEVLSEVINARIKLDMVDEALSISDDVQDAGWKAMNITSIAEAMAKNELRKRALSLLEKSIELTKKIEHTGSKITIISSIGEVLAFMGDYEKSKTIISILDSIMEILRTINEEEQIYTVISYMATLGIISRCEKFKKDIVDFINSLSNEKLKTHLNKIIAKT
jgi:tetratricopeptide (TPR) repeat protein